MTDRNWWHVHTTHPDYCHGGATGLEPALDLLAVIRETRESGVIVDGADPENCPHGADQPRFVARGVEHRPS
jgi:hypothetical protein